MIASEEIRLRVVDPEGFSSGILGRKICDDSKVVMRKTLLPCLEDLT